jgi:hypothetical protein
MPTIPALVRLSKEEWEFSVSRGYVKFPTRLGCTETVSDSKREQLLSLESSNSQHRAVCVSSAAPRQNLYKGRLAGFKFSLVMLLFLQLIIFQIVGLQQMLTRKWVWDVVLLLGAWPESRDSRFYLHRTEGTGEEKVTPVLKPSSRL